MIAFPALEELNKAIRVLFPDAHISLAPVMFGDIAGGHVATIEAKMPNGKGSLRDIVAALPKTVCLEFVDSITEEECHGDRTTNNSGALDEADADNND